MADRSLAGKARRALQGSPAPAGIGSLRQARCSRAGQDRQADQSQQDQGRSQAEPEPPKDHRVTSVFALIAIVSSLFRHLPSAPVRGSIRDRSPHPEARRSKAKGSWNLVPRRLWQSCDPSIPKQPCPPGIYPHADQGMGLASYFNTRVAGVNYHVNVRCTLSRKRKASPGSWLRRTGSTRDRRKLEERRPPFPNGCLTFTSQ